MIDGSKVSQITDEPEAHQSWQRFCDQMLLRTKIFYEKGYESAFWDAILFCEQTNTPKPAWLSKALGKYARKRISECPGPKRSGPRSDLFFDAYVYESVQYWREQVRAFGKAGKSRQFSYDEAFRRVQSEFKSEGKHHEIAMIRQAYKRGRAVASNPEAFYVSPLLSQSR